MAQYPLVLDDDLKEALEKEAKYLNRSLNNYLNCILLQREPLHTRTQTDEERAEAPKTQDGMGG